MSDAARRWRQQAWWLAQLQLRASHRRAALYGRIISTLITDNKGGFRDRIGEEVYRGIVPLPGTRRVLRRSLDDLPARVVDDGFGYMERARAGTTLAWQRYTSVGDENGKRSPNPV